MTGAVPPGGWGPPGPATGVSIAWAGGPPAGPLAAADARLDVGVVLRLVAAGLLLLAAALTAIAPFCDLLTVDYTGSNSFAMTGWDGTGESDGTSILFGVPLLVVAVGLLIAGGCTAAARWVDRLRPVAVGGAVLSVATLIAVVWLVAGYSRGIVEQWREGGASDFVAETGAGTLLMTLALLAGVAALAALLFAALADRGPTDRQVIR